MIKNKKILAIISIMVLCVTVLTGCNINKKTENGSGEQNIEQYEQPIKNFLEGIEEGNIDKFLSSFPDYLAELLKENISEEDLQEMLKNEIKSYGDNVKYSYNITEKKELSQDNLKNLQSKIKSNMDKEVNVTNGYELKVEIITKGDKDEQKDLETLQVYEIDGKWCLTSL